MAKAKGEQYLGKTEAIWDDYNADIHAASIRPSDVTSRKDLPTQYAELIEDEVLNALHEVDKQIRLRKGWAIEIKDIEDMWYKVFEMCLGAVNEVKKDIQLGPKEDTDEVG